MTEFEKHFLEMEEFERALQPFIPLKMIPVKNEVCRAHLEDRYFDSDIWDYPEANYRGSANSGISLHKDLRDSIAHYVAPSIARICCEIGNTALGLKDDVQHVIFYMLFGTAYYSNYTGTQDGFWNPVVALMRLPRPVTKLTKRINIVIEIPDLSMDSYHYGEDSNSEVAIYSVPVKYDGTFHVTDYDFRSDVNTWLPDVITDKMTKMGAKHLAQIKAKRKGESNERLLSRKVGRCCESGGSQ